LIETCRRFLSVLNSLIIDTKNLCYNKEGAYVGTYKDSTYCPVLLISTFRLAEIQSRSKASNMPCSSSNLQNVLLHIPGTFFRKHVGHPFPVMGTMDPRIAVRRRGTYSSGPRVLHPQHAYEGMGSCFSHHDFLLSSDVHVYRVLVHMHREG
jgi:hypothetical protein